MCFGINHTLGTGSQHQEAAPRPAFLLDPGMLESMGNLGHLVSPSMAEVPNRHRQTDLNLSVLGTALLC